MPPHAWFVVGAVFHYLGLALAVLLFPAVGGVDNADVRGGLRFTSAGHALDWRGIRK